MDNRILMAGAAVVVVGAAAFAGGYYINHSGAPPPAPASTQAMAPATEPPAQTAAPVAATASEPAATVPVATGPVQAKRRLPDYASGETAYGPPPPPPPPPPARDFGGPNPFEARFATFPMHHSGAGTLESPFTWMAQTDIGHGREADLRVSIVVPMPQPGDNGAFWSKWGSRRNDDVMPDITRGTPVVIAASASVVVAIDPRFLDLDAPAILSVNGPDGQRIYRSRDVAPARGESWDAQGARWIFQPDADFFRMMRDGANVSISFRGRMPGNPITVPFETQDFPPSLTGFARDLYARMPGIAAAWDRARPGAPPPPRENTPPPNYPQAYYPQQPNGPFGGPPPHGGQWQNGPQPPYGQQPQPQASAPPNAPPPAAPPAQSPSQSGDGNGHGSGDHAHDHVAANEPSAPPPAAARPNPPPAAPAPAPPSAPPAPPAHSEMTPPPKPVVAQNPPAPPPPRTAAVNPGTAMIAAEVAAYRPPADDCGPQPATPQNPGPSPERKAANEWLKCRAHWIDTYKKGVNMLSRDAARQGTPLEAVSGGNEIVAAFEKSQGEFNAQRAEIKP
jgi:hypothetical protein